MPLAGGNINSFVRAFYTPFGIPFDDIHDAVNFLSSMIQVQLIISCSAYKLFKLYVVGLLQVCIFYSKQTDINCQHLKIQLTEHKFKNLKILSLFTYTMISTQLVFLTKFSNVLQKCVYTF